MQFILFFGLLALVIVAIVLVRRSAQRGTPEETRRAMAERAAWIAENRIWIALAFGGGLIMLTGVGMWVHAMLGETRDIDLARLEAGETLPGGDFVRTHAFARGELAVCRDTRSGTACHVPLTSSATGTTVAALLSTSDLTPREGTFAGMVWTDDVWGLDEVRARGVTVTDGAFVVLNDETPEERRPIGIVMALIGAALAAVGAIALRRARRAQV